MSGEEEEEEGLGGGGSKKRARLQEEEEAAAQQGVDASTSPPPSSIESMSTCSPDEEEDEEKKGSVVVIEEGQISSLVQEANTSLCQRVQALLSTLSTVDDESQPPRLLSTTLHPWEWEEGDGKARQWVGRRFHALEPQVLFPYFSRVGEGGGVGGEEEEEDNGGASAFLAAPLTKGPAQQVAVSVFQYGEDSFLNLYLYLVGSSKEGEEEEEGGRGEARLLCKYLLSTHRVVLSESTLGQDPVVLEDLNKALSATHMHKEDLSQWWAWWSSDAAALARTHHAEDEEGSAGPSRAQSPSTGTLLVDVLRQSLAAWKREQQEQARAQALQEDVLEGI